MKNWVNRKIHPGGLEEFQGIRRNNDRYSGARVSLENSCDQPARERQQRVASSSLSRLRSLSALPLSPRLPFHRINHSTSHSIGPPTTLRESRHRGEAAGKKRRGKVSHQGPTTTTGPDSTSPLPGYDLLESTIMRRLNSVRCCAALRFGIGAFVASRVPRYPWDSFGLQGAAISSLLLARFRQYRTTQKQGTSCLSLLTERIVEFTKVEAPIKVPSVLLEKLLLAVFKTVTNYGFVTNHGNCKYSEQDY